MKLLLHTCCAPCSVYCIKRLRKEKIEPVVYWFNPNIHPYIEYKTRRDCLDEYTKSIGIKAIFEENYGLREFCKNVSGDIQNRCRNYCYRVRLEQAAKYAKENGYDAFTTTLLVSIYQNHKAVKEIAEEMAEKYQIEFLYIDFRVGFREGQEEARRIGLYMQKYCGCIFSEEDRYLNKKQTKLELPEGFEFNKQNPLEVKKVENIEEYMKLLQEGDSKENIEKYINDSDIYGLKKDDEIIAIAIIKQVNRKILEIKNLVTKEEYRGKGYTKKLLKSLCGNYKQKYEKIVIQGKGESLPYFIKQGFETFEEELTKENKTNYYSKKLK